ncbi:nucleotidyl transferase AbiEii/AbiGii toxin family protein [Hyphococcus flavus]|jgi:predicted nucleotidyltransferase component of viral defense system|uniref:Nucleotidyl transferase AbiEii/AbiGii toxin family protein n=1 Tax=Hyphococcus flavus TaxID=1866326 RepID=A0AAE9ZJT0_9PROT|nr:nucleotidyl transferase AbiEii/AbiGii toxin family protein [Hyphococcus flavus]MCA8887944.1 nucleotidyl transferase AbiEii/AbiGii toxin family protein [Parvularculaceae bacterium]WDI31890.1 nucleotidyl transferase AbiEii/AbiGii toxin family protein [Hyphococcus flavus]
MMLKRQAFEEQVRLLVRVLPYVARETDFALKGGTAINFFLRDMPRLSVDIDLAYLPLEPRETALPKIRAALARIGEQLMASSPAIATIDPPAVRENELRLLIRHGRTQVKLELSPVLRGTVFPPETRTIGPAVENAFGYAEMQVLSHADLYAGKICAALDRQHPRDLFDIKLLLENEGVDRKLIDAFLVYLISHNRPIAELLAPNPKDVKYTYEAEFAAMTALPPTLEDLYQARGDLLQRIHESLTEKDRAFLISVKSGDPDWSLLNTPNAEQLPAVQWKLQNIRRMTKDRRNEALARLRIVLGA